MLCVALEALGDEHAPSLPSLLACSNIFDDITIANFGSLTSAAPLFSTCFVCLRHSMMRKAELEADNAKYAAAFKDGHRPGPPVKQMVRGPVASCTVPLLNRRHAPANCSTEWPACGTDMCSCSASAQCIFMQPW